MDWPVSPDAAQAPLGDGRFATYRDQPRSVAELQEAVVRRSAEGLAIYPQGGRTALDYGGIPRRPGAALDVTGVREIIDYPAADMTVTVEAGITLASLQSTLAKEGQFLPLDAPQAESATLGGIYATNTSGPRRFGWGRPRDLIIGVSFVTADGKLVKGGGRVVKNVAGYDFPKLMTGSMGTLGVLTQLTLKTRPKPQSSALVISVFEDFNALSAVVAQLNTSLTRPVAIEVLNPAALPGREWNLPVNGWRLVVGLEDNEPSVKWQINKLAVELKQRRDDCVVLENESSTGLWSELTEFPAQQERGSFSMLATLPRAKVLGFETLFDSARWAVKVQPGSGTLQAHVIGEWADSDFVAIVHQLQHDAAKEGGAAIVARCPFSWKEQVEVWGPRRGDWAIMERIKDALDPSKLLNPGRFVGTI